MATTILLEETTEVSETFRVESESSANWVLGLYARVDEEEARITTQYKKRVAELRAERERLDFRFRADLEAWARDEATRRRRRSVTLLNGSISFRAVPERLSIVDLTEATERAHMTNLKDTEGNPLTASVLMLNKAEYLALAKDRLSETGELLPGVELIPESESVKVKTPTATAIEEVSE